MDLSRPTALKSEKDDLPLPTRNVRVSPVSETADPNDRLPTRSLESVRPVPDEADSDTGVSPVEELPLSTDALEFTHIERPLPMPVSQSTAIPDSVVDLPLPTRNVRVSPVSETADPNDRLPTRSLESVRPVPDEADPKLVNCTRIEPRLIAGWLVGLLAISIAVILVILVSQRIQSTFQILQDTHPVWAIAYAVAVAAALGSLAWIGIGASRRYRRLSDISRFQSLAADVQSGQRKDWHEVRSGVDKYLSSVALRGSDTLRDQIKSCRAKLQDFGGAPKDDLKHLNDYVLCHLDQEASAVIYTAAIQTGVATALVTRHIDLWIVAMQSVALVDRVSTIYAGRPGRLGTLRLLLRAISTLAMTEVAEVGGEFFEAAIGGKIAAWGGKRAVEGVANGMFMRRLGEAVRRACRPIPVT